MSRSDTISYMEDRIKYAVSEVICINCKKRWISCHPASLLLKEIECPNCGKGYVIKTGERIGCDE